MLAKTRGIVIRNTRYGEGSLISKIYSRSFGMQSYIVNGVYNAKSSLKASLLQPLTILDLVVYHNKFKEIQRIKEAKCPYQLVSLHFDNRKTGICLFISEILNKTIKEEEPNDALFDFVEQSIIGIDLEQGSLAIWPILFLIRLSKWLGFAPDNNFDETENVYFDLAEGMFSPFPQKSEWAIAPPESHFLSALIACLPDEGFSLQIPKKSRLDILHKLILYYKLHLFDFQDIKSIEVLSGIA